jgi:hypothetical protein
MSSSTIATYIFALNAIWDAVTGTGLLAFGLTGRFRLLADTHLCLWVSELHKTDSVLSSLSGLFVIQWGIIRALAATDPTTRWPDAASSYCVEGVAVTAAALTGKMHCVQSMMVVTLCLAGAALAVAAGVTK